MDKKRFWQNIMGITMLMIVTMVAGRMGMMEKNGSWAAEAAAGKAQKKNQPVVVIDSGHGGMLYRRK
jgi:N-acetylmuramoyl-L-alanine amidase